MLRTVAPIVLLLACGLALAGCSWSYTSTGNTGGIGAGAGGVSPGGAEPADEAVKALNSFTEELLSRVEKAENTKDGVADAHGFLAARRGEVAGHIAALKRGAQDSGSKAKWLEAEVDNTDRVHRLQLRYADAAARDPVLKSRLERLIADYDALFR